MHSNQSAIFLYHFLLNWKNNGNRKVFDKIDMLGSFETVLLLKNKKNNGDFIGANL